MRAGMTAVIGALLAFVVGSVAQEVAPDDIRTDGYYQTTKADGTRVLIPTAAPIDRYGNPTGTVTNPITANVTTTGTSSTTLSVEEMTPLTQVDTTWGIPSGAYVQQTTGTGGSLAGGTGYVDLASGTSAGGLATMRTTRLMKMRAGQEIEARVTAKFDDCTTGSVQLVGPQTAADGMGIGCNGAAFSAFYKDGGVREVQTLTLSAGTGGAETVTITLNGTAVPVAIGGALATAPLAAELAEADYSTAGVTLVRAEASTVVYVFDDAGDKTGSMTLASSGTAAGTFSETTAGVTGTDVWTPQASFSVDPLDGTGPSGLVVDPQTLNTWTFVYSDTEVRHYVTPPNDGRKVLYHEQTAVGAEDALFQNPTFPIQALAVNTTGTTNKTLRVYDMAGLLRGPLRRLGARRGVSATKASVGTSFVPILSLTGKAAFGDPARAFNNPIYFPFVALTVDGNQAARFRVVINADLTGASWTDVSAAGATLMDTAATAYTGGVTIASFPLPKSGAGVLDLRDLDLEIYPSGVYRVTIAAAAVSSTTTVFAAPTYIEDR